MGSMKIAAYLGDSPRVRLVASTAQTAIPSRSPPRCSNATTASRTSRATSSRPTKAACCAPRRPSAARVAIKRPGRMRFIYTKPERKEFVSDGDRLYTLPRRRQAGDRQPGARPRRGRHPGDVPGRPVGPRPRLHADASRHCPALQPGCVTLKLVPKKPRPGLRVARHRRRPEDAPDPVPGRRRHAGRPIVVHLQLT